MELPHVQKIYEKFSQGFDEFQVLAVEINDDREGADIFIEENGLTFIFSEADRAFVTEKFNTAGFPNSFIINRDATITLHKLGFRDGDEVSLAEQLLKELEDR